MRVEEFNLSRQGRTPQTEYGPGSLIKLQLNKMSRLPEEVDVSVASCTVAVGKTIPQRVVWIEVGENWIIVFVQGKKGNIRRKGFSLFRIVGVVKRSH